MNKFKLINVNEIILAIYVIQLIGILFEYGNLLKRTDCIMPFILLNIYIAKHSISQSNADWWFTWSKHSLKLHPGQILYSLSHNDLQHLLGNTIMWMILCLNFESFIPFNQQIQVLIWVIFLSFAENYLDQFKNSNQFKNFNGYKLIGASGWIYSFIAFFMYELLNEFLYGKYDWLINDEIESKKKRKMRLLFIITIISETVLPFIIPSSVEKDGRLVTTSHKTHINGFIFGLSWILTNSITSQMGSCGWCFISLGWCLISLGWSLIMIIIYCICLICIQYCSQFAIFQKTDIWNEFDFLQFQFSYLIPIIVIVFEILNHLSFYQYSTNIVTCFAILIVFYLCFPKIENTNIYISLLFLIATFVLSGNRMWNEANQSSFEFLMAICLSTTCYFRNILSLPSSSCFIWFGMLIANASFSRELIDIIILFLLSEIICIYIIFNFSNNVYQSLKGKIILFGYKTNSQMTTEHIFKLIFQEVNFCVIYGVVYHLYFVNR